MRTHFIVSPCSQAKMSIPIGRQGENGVTQIVFKTDKWLEDFPGGTVMLIARRQIDAEPYPVQLDVVGTSATWTVNNADTAVHGRGECELRWMQDGRILKSQIFDTYCARSLGAESAEPPDPWESWVEEVLQAGSQAQEAAEDAEEAKEAAESARDAAIVAKTAAETAQGKAEEAASHYPYIGENGNWFVWDADSKKYVDTGIHAGGTAADTTYDNAESGLTATNVQDAIDELAESGGGGVSSWSNLTGKPFETIGDNLKIVGRALTVDTAPNVEQDNTKPITSAAVYTEVGNINALLALI